MVRLEGRGIATPEGVGDHLVALEVMIPNAKSESLVRIFEELRDEEKENERVFYNAKYDPSVEEAQPKRMEREIFSDKAGFFSRFM